MSEKQQQGRYAMRRFAISRYATATLVLASVCGARARPARRKRSPTRASRSRTWQSRIASWRTSPSAAFRSSITSELIADADVELGSPIEETEDARGRRDAPTVEVDDPPFRSPMVAELVAHLRFGEPCERVGVEAAEDLRNDAPVAVLGERQIGEEELILAHR